MRLFRVIFFLGVGLLSLGTVVKKKGAIEMTQTDPILYEEKKKEEKEGKKGPPAPSLKLFPKERFLAEGPVEAGREAKEIKPDLQTDDTSDTSEELWDFSEETALDEWEDWAEGEEESPFLDRKVK